MAKSISTRRVLVTSFFVDLLDVIINVSVAVITGSAVMLAEALQGITDLASVGMLLIGFKRSKKRSNKQHPFGYGKEQYFWALISTLLIIGVTSTLSFYFGLQMLLHPHPVKYLWLACAVLLIALVSNTYAFWLSLHKLLDGLPRRELPRVFVGSPNVAPSTTLVLDAIGAFSALFGLIALLVYGLTGNTMFDGIGAMVIGLLLLGLAMVLLITTRALVTGRSASSETENAITEAALHTPKVRSILDLRTMMLGTDNILVNLEVHLKNGLSTDEVEEVMDEIKKNVRKALPGRIHITVEPETPSKPRRKGYNRV